MTSSWVAFNLFLKMRRVLPEKWILSATLYNVIDYKIVTISYLLSKNRSIKNFEITNQYLVQYWQYYTD